MTGKIKLVHSGGNSVSLAVPTSNPSASEVEFKLPQADGSTGQFMKTDGSGNLAFATVSVPAGNIVFAEACVRGASGSPTVTRSTGFGSLTDNGSGDFTLAFSSAQADANYTVVGAAGFTGNGVDASVCVTGRNGSNGYERPNTTTAVNFGTVNDNLDARDVVGNIYIACMRG